MEHYKALINRQLLDTLRTTLANNCSKEMENISSVTFQWNVSCVTKPRIGIVNDKTECINNHSVDGFQITTDLDIQLNTGETLVNCSESKQSDDSIIVATSGPTKQPVTTPPTSLDVSDTMTDDDESYHSDTEYGLDFSRLRSTIKKSNKHCETLVNCSESKQSDDSIIVATSVSNKQPVTPPPTCSGNSKGSSVYTTRTIKGLLKIKPLECQEDGCESTKSYTCLRSLLLHVQKDHYPSELFVLCPKCPTWTTRLCMVDHWNTRPKGNYYFWDHTGIFDKHSYADHCMKEHGGADPLYSQSWLDLRDQIRQKYYEVNRGEQPTNERAVSAASGSKQQKPNGKSNNSHRTLRTKKDKEHRIKEQGYFYKCSVEGCKNETKFIDADGFIRHTAGIHHRDRMFVCCPKCSSNMSRFSMRRHWKLMHDNEQYCLEHNGTFNKQSYVAHCTKEHGGDDPLFPKQHKEWYRRLRSSCIQQEILVTVVTEMVVTIINNNFIYLWGEYSNGLPCIVALSK